MEVTEELEHQVSLIVQQEAAKGLVEGVYLFGSQVRGNAIVDSDLDVAVIISDESKLSQIDYGRLYNLFSDVFSEQEVDLRLVTRESSPLFLFQMLKYGQCLYAPDESQRVDLESDIMRRYYDTQHLRDIYHQYLVKSIKNKTYGHALSGRFKTTAARNNA